MRPYIVDRGPWWSLRRRWYWIVQIAPEGWHLAGWTLTRRAASRRALEQATRR